MGGLNLDEGGFFLRDANGVTLVGHIDHIQYLQLRFFDVLQGIAEADLGTVLALEDVKQELALGMDYEDALAQDD